MSNSHGFAVEIETTERTATGAERRKIVKVRWPVVLLAGVIALLALNQAGMVDLSDLSWVAGLQRFFPRG